MFFSLCCCCQTREARINDNDAPKIFIDDLDDFSLKTPAATAVQSENELEESVGERRRSRNMSEWSFRKSIAAESVDELLRELEDDESFIEVAVENGSSSQGTVEPLLRKEEAPSEPCSFVTENSEAAPEEQMGKRDTLKAGVKAITNRGRELFERMALSRKQEESNTPEADTLPKAERMRISTQRLQSGKWRVFGIHEDIMVKIGLEVLDKSFSENGLMHFPRRKNGSSMLLREPLIKSMLNGSRDLKSTHKGDVSAAQGDIKHLSFRQLLKLRTLHLDYDPTRHESTKVQAAFLQSLDQNLFEHLPKTVIGETASLFAVQSLRKFGLELTLLVAANDALSSGRGSPQPWWACYLQGQLVYFDASAFSVDADFPKCGVLQIKDLSKPDGHRRAIDWNVTHVSLEDDLSKSVVSFDADSSSFSYGAQGASFTVSRETLSAQLRSLKKVE